MEKPKSEGLWKQTSKAGKDYMSGKCPGCSCKLAIFKNDKKSENGPDWQAIVSVKQA